ncbi:hypothetical protein ACFX19_029538 [Malus domestica]
MGKQSGKNLGFGKRKMPNRFNTGKKSRRLEEENVAHSPASTSSGELPNEESNGVVSEEETVYKEPSMYDKLLMTLGSSSKSVSAAYKLRKRQEEGISDSENSEDDGSESSSDSEDADNDEEGVDDEDPEMAGIEEHSEDSENEDDQETSAFDDEETHDSDAEQDLGTSSQSAVEPSMCLSSFDIHWGHKLTKAEVENLSKKKWTYEWEVPAVGMTKGNWAGTGECFTKVCYPFMTCTIFILCLFVKALEMISFALVLSIEAPSRVKATESTFVLPYLSFLLFNSGSDDRSCSLHTLEEPPLRANHTYSY